jgi:hypothetical protein
MIDIMPWFYDFNLLIFFKHFMLLLICHKPKLSCFLLADEIKITLQLLEYRIKIHNIMVLSLYSKLVDGSIVSLEALKASSKLLKPSIMEHFINLVESFRHSKRSLLDHKLYFLQLVYFILLLFELLWLYILKQFVKASPHHILILISINFKLRLNHLFYPELFLKINGTFGVFNVFL